MDDTDKNKIIALNNAGITNREIAKQTGFHHATVAYVLKRAGLRSQWCQAPINKISETEAKCSKCFQIKPLIQFQHGRRGQKYEYKFSYCNDCRKKQAYDNLNRGVTFRLKDSFNRLKKRAEKEGIEFNLDIDYFLKLFFLQDGNCLYLKQKMEWKVNNGGIKDNSLSVDRMDNSKGYIKGNVVFCCHRANTAKGSFSLREIEQWMPVWFNEIKSFRRRLESKEFQAVRVPS